jgi:threonine dehydrogenase-like Zn-dependent dehydrogenase
LKVAVVTAPGQVELREEPAFDVGPDEVLVEVGACGLCTMERRLFAGEKQIYPVAPGHEVAGAVVAVGAAVEGVAGVPAVGDRVIVDLLTRCGACRQCRRGRSALCRVPQGGALSDGTISMGAGLAEHVKVRASSAYVVGDAAVEHASMGEPLACVVHSVRLSGFRAGDRVAVVGSGFMGRLHVALCRQSGATSVGVVDVSRERLAEASAAGASWTSTPDDAAVDAARRATAGSSLVRRRRAPGGRPGHRGRPTRRPGAPRSTTRWRRSAWCRPRWRSGARARRRCRSTDASR